MENRNQESSESTAAEKKGPLPAVSLPKGGGAIHGIDEKFAANPATGTGSFSVPILTSSGRAEFGPKLSLSYDSGAGNGPFGIGWQLSLPRITRKTDKGLPLYADAVESDEYILSGSEDLIPVLKADGSRFEDAVSAPGYLIHRYRPRVEGLFGRIERWTHGTTGEILWRSITKENVTTVYGSRENSRIFDPGDARRVYTWLICESYDDKGNAIAYQYAAENSDLTDQTLANERNRVPTANRYLKRIHYGNKTPRVPGEDLSLRTDWMFEVVFDYFEEHYQDLDLNPALPDAQQHRFVLASASAAAKWALRPDPFSTYRSGFEVRTYRRCSRVMMFHRFAELGAEPCLVRSTEFAYQDLNYSVPPSIEQELSHQGSTRFASFIRGITQSGFVRDEAKPFVVRNGVSFSTYLRKSIPTLELEYSQAVVQDDLRELDSASLENLPVGLNGPVAHWVDLDGEGVSGILMEQADAWFYKPNLGEGRFGPVARIPTAPSLTGLTAGTQQLLDLAGDGQLDAVSFGSPAPGFYERTLEGGWQDFRALLSLPNVPWNDRNLRFVDLNGDGHADILLTEHEAFTWYPSLGEDGFGAGVRVPTPLDEEKGPRLIVADGTESIYLADMSGDGLTDLVRIRNGEVCYWPNLGYGRFGAKVTMDNAPWLDNPDQFSDARIQLADIDGSGVTDIIYLGRDCTRLYFNQSGNRWSGVRTLAQFPTVTDPASVTATDLLGNGTACLVWSSPLPADARSPLRYVDLMGGNKPHLLVKMRNNLGAETYVRYVSSTKFYLADKAAGNPWITRLAFPVHVVERVETFDRISRNRFVKRYAYRHGYFDGEEREFRGFGLVEQYDTEEIAALTASGAFPTGDNIDEQSAVPPVLTKTWFHTGIYVGGQRVSDYFAGAAGKPGEYYAEGVDPQALLLEDTKLPPGLSAEDEREACRALKGSMLRQEVYGLDGTARAGHPYKVTEQNFTVEVVQSRGDNRHAIFFTHARETLTYDYERDPADPRVGHALTLEVDPFGNVLKQASIGYGRRTPDLSLTAADRTKQAIPLLTYTENDFTTEVDEANNYRTPLPSETRTYELTGMVLSAGAVRFTLDEVLTGGAGAAPLDYEQTPGGGHQKRLIEQMRTYYRRNDLTGALPLGQLESLALPFETYKLALTPGLVTSVFGARISNAQLAANGPYVHTEGDANWWIPSGRTFLSPDTAHTAPQELLFARAHFFLPHRFRDPFHTPAVPTEIFVVYDAYDLLISEKRDAVGNRVTAGERDILGVLVTPGNDYRVLQPRLVMDPNRNRSVCSYDALGLVAGTAAMGKPAPAAEGDSITPDFAPDLTEATILEHLTNPLAAPQAILRHATTRIVYDLLAYQRTQGSAKPQPATVYTLARETHDLDPMPPGGLKFRHSFSYSDGFGREIQKKVQAEAGPAPARDGGGNLIIGPDGLPVMTAASVSPRWTGSGWQVLNNKGKPVRRYEPFFSDTHRFEFDVRAGVSPVLFYDPAERVAATLHPNHSWEKVVFNAWRKETWDVNDTIRISDPTADNDAAGFFRRLPTAEFMPSWYDQRQGGALGAEEQTAARNAAIHRETPTVTHFDVLGREFLTVAHNKLKYSDTPLAVPPVEEFYRAAVEFDIEGNERTITDARGRIAMRYDYDMLGNRIHQASMEAGERWTLNDVSGKPLYAWDSFNRQFETVYDRARRPIETLLRLGAGAPIVVLRTVYGESVANPEDNNLRTKTMQVFDQAGVVTTDRFDFKGNLLRTRRELAAVYQATLDWSGAVALGGGVFISSTRYDALNRPTEITTPDASVIRHTYNEAGLLNQVEANLRGAAAATTFISNIDYDSKGQRTQIDNGNGVRTRLAYDPLTFRLVRLDTRRDPLLFPADCPQPPVAGWPGCQVQDLRYTYDPAGNVTNIRDDAQQTRYFQNQRVEPSTAYTYDAIYRLIEAAGREHLGQAGGAPIPHSNDDAARMRIPLSTSDGNAMGRYLERYRYDEAGNLKEMGHEGTDPANPGWTRAYLHDELSQLEPAKRSNRLTSTTIGALVETYSTAGNGYDAHGNMLRLPHLQAIQWDFKDQLQMTRRQAVNPGGSGEQTWYVYDASGQRVRKVTELAPGQIQDERVYLGGFEVYRRQGVNALVRETLHIMDTGRRIALVETRTDVAPQQLIRYQYGNHLGSASLELDHQAEIISYEEYTPFGSTSYQAVRSQTEAAKRYRYTGMERDEENGASYHTARYYLPWLGRWMSADPKGLIDGPNLYRYSRNNPVKLSDPNGTDPPSADDPPVRVTPLLTQFNPTGISGNFQLNNVFSSNRSISGRGSLSGSARFGFALEIPSLDLTLPGLANVSGTAAVDTSLGRAGVALRGDLVLGDPSGLNLVVVGEGAFRIPVPSQIVINGLPGSLLPAPSEVEGDLRLRGSLALGTPLGTFGLAEFNVNASQNRGLILGNFDLTAGVPGVRLNARGTAAGSFDDGLVLRTTADLRLLGLPSLHADATGSVSRTEASLTGTFSGAGPLFTSYIRGSFDLSTRTGVQAQAGVFGLTYSPTVSLSEAPPEVTGRPPSPQLKPEFWEPGGLTLGASFFQYSHGNFNYVSAGYMPDLGNLSNPRFGVTTQFHF